MQMQTETVTEAISQVSENVYFEEIYADNEDLESILKTVKKITDMIEANEVRRLITDEKIRPDGRKMDEIRDLSAEVDGLMLEGTTL